MKYFRNLELKYLSIKFLVIFILSSICISFICYIEGEKLNKIYIKQNIIIAGNILSKNPDLEDEVIKGITSKNQENYNLGKEILSKYSYDKLTLKENPSILNFFYKFTIIIMLVIILFLIMAIIFAIKGYIKFYKKIEEFTIVAEEVVEGNFNLIKEEYDEGELYIFSNKFNLMINRLNNSVKKLKEEKLFLKNIISDISHQLKTPLASLIMFNDLMKNKDMSLEDKNYFLNLSEEQLKRMEWLIISLLKLSRLEAKVIKFDIKSNPIYITIMKSISPIKEKAREKNISINLKLDEKIRFNHDLNWTAEALTNIIKNSIEHTKNGGYINIKIYETPLAIFISIEDNGEGIPKNLIPKIFKRFYKGENSTNPTSIGIGLSLSKRIIESQNGSINVESEIKKGTKFNITFLKTVI